METDVKNLNYNSGGCDRDYHRIVTANTECGCHRIYTRSNCVMP
jgi:hypothetical protein